ncbi:MAG: enoyl-CoA hydratase/isomerase family protein [Solirubrobacterales bacterium]|nr:enoyl-CoA hydratase/isomerase family protein [Solirubrobacterales bacterium]
MTDSAVQYERGDDGIVVLTLDDPTASANTMNDLYRDSMHAAIDRLYVDRDEITGVVITSAKKTFFAGGNLKGMLAATPADVDAVFAMAQDIKADLRRLEKLGKPVVAAVNGAALGGGLEITLACHHRIVVDDPKAELGLPEVTLGLLPGGGGVTRTVRMFGIQSALMDILLQGTRFKPAAAREKGLVDELVGSRDDLIPAAKAWIESVKDDPQAASNPWDRDGYKIPGGSPSSPALAQFLPAFPAMLRKQTKGAVYPATRAIMAAAIEGAQVDFDTASRIESRYLAHLIVGSNSKNMIQAFFFDLQRANGKRGRPEEIETFAPTKVVVLGAGMMGAAIAYVAARSGLDVVLRDVDRAAAERGKGYSEKLVAKGIERGKTTEQDGDALLARIHPSGEAADADGAQLVIEAVFEDPEVKREVMLEIEPHLAADALLASNTSTLPISELAENVSRPADFIGLHFFSPVDKMPLLEIIRGKQCSEETLYRALDVSKLLGKTPIVVNDSRGFFTSRVIGTFINEGIAMLTEGIPAPTIEQASAQAGYPAPVLQLSDELNMKLMQRIRKAGQAAQEGSSGWSEHPAERVIDQMVADGRPGRLEGAGFYEYEDGKRTRLWSGLRELYPPVSDPAALSLTDLEERMLFVESLETVKCLDEGVIESVADANIGSIMGIGFPGWTGGVLQYISGYEDPTGATDRRGPAGFVDRARELAERYGERFAPPASLVARAQRGEAYADEEALVSAG